MAEINKVAGDSGMLLIGADGSIKLHGGSSIFSGDQQTQHSLLAQKNADGTMNVYMVPSDGPNKGKMFMVMPSSNGGVDGQGWKMASLDDGKTILTPTYKENPVVYVPPTVLPPQIQNNITSNSSSVVNLPAEKANTDNPNQDGKLTTSSQMYSFFLPDLQKPVSSTATGFIPLTPSTVVSSATTTVSKTIYDVVNASDQAIASKIQSTSESHANETHISGTDLPKTTKLPAPMMSVKTASNSVTTTSTGIRPMLLFTHEAAANLGKNQVVTGSSSSDSENKTKSQSDSSACFKIIPSSSLVGRDRTCYPFVQSKPNILSKVKTTIVYPPCKPKSANFIQNNNTQIVNIPRNDSSSSVLQTAGNGIAKSQVVNNNQNSLQANETSTGKANISSGVPVVLCPNTSSEPSQKPKIYITSTAGSKNNSGSYISLLPLSKSSDNTKTPVASFSIRPNTVPVAVATHTKTSSDASKINPYIISLRVPAPPTSAQQNSRTSTSQNVIKNLIVSALNKASSTSHTTTSATTASNSKVQHQSSLLTSASPRLSAPFLPITTTATTPGKNIITLSNAAKTAVLQLKPPVTEPNAASLVSEHFQRSLTKTIFPNNSHNVSTVLPRALPSTYNISSHTAADALKTVANRVKVGNTNVSPSVDRNLPVKMTSSIQASNYSSVELKNKFNNLTGKYGASGAVNTPAELVKSKDTSSASQNEELSIRIDSVFSLISQDEGEETDSAEEIGNVIDDLVSENFTSDVIEPDQGSFRFPADKNILDAMKNVKLPKEALYDTLLNRPSFVVLDIKLPSKYTALNIGNPCSRKCREKFIRQREMKKMNDLELKIDVLKSKIRNKKWKNRKKENKKKENRLPGTIIAENSSLNLKTVRNFSFEEREMPQLEAASATIPVLSPKNEREMPDLLSSPTNKASKIVNPVGNLFNTTTTTVQNRISFSASSSIGNHTLPSSDDITTQSKGLSSSLPTTTVSHTISCSSPQALSQLSPNHMPVTSNTPAAVSTLNLTGSTTGATPNTKFYLIKVDDKSILIPAVNTGTQPRAYILDPQSQSTNKILPNAPLKKSAPGFPDLRIVVPTTSTTNTQLTNTWSNPTSVDSCGNNTVMSTSNVTKYSSNIQTHESSSAFSNVTVKTEPVTSGYGQETVSNLVPVIKKEKYRGYSDEFPPNDVEKSSQELQDSSSKRLSLGKGDWSEVTDHTANKVQKVEPEKSEEDKAKVEAEKEKRIKKLKDMLRKQEMALEQVRRKRFSETPTTLNVD